MAKLFNLARMTVTGTPGTGTITLNTNTTNHVTFASAGVANGDVVAYGIEDGTASESGFGTYTSAGTSLTRNLTKSTTGSLLSLTSAAEVFITPRAEDYVSATTLRGYISGLTLSNDGVTPNTILDIAAGVATDVSQLSIMVLASAYTKTTGAWAVGTGNGALDTGAIGAASWYHVFIIQRSDTEVVDILFSLSATAPTMPTNYNRKRRIGSFKTSGSNIIAFSQSGNEFLWSVPTNDILATNPGTSAILGAGSLLNVPTGVQVRAIATFLVQNTAAARVVLLVTSPDQADTAPVAGTLQTISTGLGAAAGAQSTQINVRTNTSAQVRYRVDASSATVNVFETTFGWLDNL